MPCHIFTYGSLMFPQVWEKVVRGHYRAMNAVLEDHARYAIEGETYPGMIAQSGAAVQGVLYGDVSNEDLMRLDAFEGRDYCRGTVNVRLGDGAYLIAEAYLYVAEQGLSNLPWQPESFQMHRFFDAYCNERLPE